MDELVHESGQIGTLTNRIWACMTRIVVREGGVNLATMFTSSFIMKICRTLQTKGFFFQKNIFRERHGNSDCSKVHESLFLDVWACVIYWFSMYI